MATIQPFRALRYNLTKAGSIETLACPPYDIISEEQRKDYLATNPYNVIRLELPKGDQPYKEAGNTLNQWLADGILCRDMDDGFYIYEEEFKTAVTHGEIKSFQGIICRVKVEDFANGVVLPHEETLSKAKEDRLNLLKATGCNFSQIYALYPDEQHQTLTRLENLTKTTAPRYAFDDGLVTHRLWLVNDKAAIEALTKDFMPRKLYIADGHHRYETAINYRNYCREQQTYTPGSEYVMMMLVDMAHPGLVVFPTHRLLHNLPHFDPAALISACAPYFTVEPQADISVATDLLKGLYQQNKKAFCFYTGGKGWTLLTLKDLTHMTEALPEKSPASQGLDVSVLHSLILEKLLGIDKENMANQVNLRYTRSFAEAVEQVETGKSQCAFIMNPTRVSEIGEVAAAGEKMPQKSTYFYPKLTTGLVMNQLEP